MRRRIQHLDIYPDYGSRIERGSGFKKLLNKVVPRHTLLPFWQELYAFRVRLTSRNVHRRYKNSSGLLVNIGAGDKGRPGWVNMDVLKLPGVNCVYDSRKSLPFPDNSVKGIFCEHFFEHIDYTEEVPYFLSECHRVLLVEGVIRIIVPDIERYLHGYVEEGWDALNRLRPLDADRKDFYVGNRYNTKMELINVLFRQGHEHKFAYDYETLSFLLRRYGFDEVYKQEFGKTIMPELLIDTPQRATESLYVEAVKKDIDRGVK